MQDGIEARTGELRQRTGAPSPRGPHAARPTTLLVGAALAAIAPSAHAVRPFVTDDGRIVDTGQIEMENWLESSRVNGGWDPAPGFNAILGVTVNDWLEILGGSGLGRNRGGGTAVGNPVLIGKVLLQQSTPGGRPGHAVSIAHVFDEGRGALYDAGSVTSLVGMTTFRLQDDTVQLHVNYGYRSERLPGRSREGRLYWGVGSEIETPIPKVTFVIEAFAGDPFVPDAPTHAFQSGLRFHRSSHRQLDLTFGWDPRRDDAGRRESGYELTAQLGIRVLFDAFTRDGRPGSADGARGLFRKLPRDGAGGS